MKLRILISTLGLLVAATVIAPSANSAEYPAFSASCTVGSTSSFTATKKGYYTYVWRTGNSVNGYGVKYLSAGASWSPNTPGTATTSTRFGVVTTSTSFAYVTCMSGS